MDHNFTREVQAWLDTEASKRDYAKGAVYMLQLSNNQIMYRNVMGNPEGRAEFIEYQIRKYMKFRLAELTHDDVNKMQEKVERIASSHGLVSSSKSEFKSGKRDDHESLPTEIQALYVENASIMQKMRELHLQLRSLSNENATCPDSDRYPFLKELIDLDKEYHDNWKRYDSWSAENAAADAEQTLIEDERMRVKNIYRNINLSKGRYRKNPTDALKEQLRSLYEQLPTPPETLTSELREMGVIE